MLSASPTELTTAATDVALAAESLGVALWMWSSGGGGRLRIWAWLFLLLAMGAVLGALAHALVLDASIHRVLWRGVYLSLALVMALFVAGAVADGWDQRAARRLLPWLLSAGLLFLVAAEWLGGAFILFIIYEVGALSVAMVIYLVLAAQDRLPGALLIGWGILLSLLAAWVQITDISVDIIVPFDHNGLFHLTQMMALLFLAVGLQRGGTQGN